MSQLGAAARCMHCNPRCNKHNTRSIPNHVAFFQGDCQPNSRKCSREPAFEEAPLAETTYTGVCFRSIPENTQNCDTRSVLTI